MYSTGIPLFNIPHVPILNHESNAHECCDPMNVEYCSQQGFGAQHRHPLTQECLVGDIANPNATWDILLRESDDVAVAVAVAANPCGSVCAAIIGCQHSSTPAFMAQLRNFQAYHVCLPQVNDLA